jgi:hypothetical protein
MILLFRRWLARAIRWCLEAEMPPPAIFYSEDHPYRIVLRTLE